MREVNLNPIQQINLEEEVVVNNQLNVEEVNNQLNVEVVNNQLNVEEVVVKEEVLEVYNRHHLNL